MTKVVKKNSLHKGKRRILKGVIHIQASFNNTIVIVIDIRGQAIFWSSVGACGFRGMKKSMPFVAQTAVKNVIRMLIDQGMKQAEVMISGSSPRRDTTLRTIRRSGVILNFVRDVIPMPHNGCIPPKKRRV